MDSTGRHSTGRVSKTSTRGYTYLVVALAAFSVAIGTSVCPPPGAIVFSLAFPSAALILLGLGIKNLLRNVGEASGLRKTIPMIAIASATVFAAFILWVMFHTHYDASF